MASVYLNIVDAAKLSDAAATLHDAKFFAEGIVHLSDKREFHLKCFQPAGFKYGQFAPIRVWRGFSLVFRGVKTCDVKFREEVDHYEVWSLLYSEKHGSIKILTTYAVDLTLTVDFLNGELIELDEERTF